MRARIAEPAVGRGLHVVADDWGLSPGVNLGILALCEAGVVRGVSVLANLEHTERDLAGLRGAPVEVSLHLNLTLGRPLSRPDEVPSLCGADDCFQPLRALLGRCLAGRVSPGEIALEGSRQIRRLRSLGLVPRGVEGHHHVHLLPRVAAALAPVLEAEGVAWLRLPADPVHAPSWLAGHAHLAWQRWGRAPPALGDLEWRPTLRLCKADLRSDEAFAAKMARAAGRPVIAHPAQCDDLAAVAHPDPYRAGRLLEYRRLMDLARRPREHGDD